MLDDKDIPPVLFREMPDAQPMPGARMCSRSRCSWAMIVLKILQATSFINFLSALGMSLRRVAGAKVPNELMTHVTLVGIYRDRK